MEFCINSDPSSSFFFFRGTNMVGISHKDVDNSTAEMSPCCLFNHVIKLKMTYDISHIHFNEL